MIVTPTFPSEGFGYATDAPGKLIGRRSLFLVSVFVTTFWGYPASANDYPPVSYGRWFFVAVVQNEVPADPCGYLTIATDSLMADISIKLPTDIRDYTQPGTTIKKRVTREESFEAPIPKRLIVKEVGKGASIEIRATSPVSVILMNQGLHASVDAATIPCIDAWGRDYILIDVPGGTSWFFTGAKHNTTVSVEFGMAGKAFNVANCVDQLPCKTGEIVEVSLGRGEIFYFTTPNADLTGTKITSDKRGILVMCGINIKSTDSSKDFMMSSVKPSTAWGKRHLFANTLPAKKCMNVMVMAKSENTIVEVKPATILKNTTIAKAYTYKSIKLDNSKSNVLFEIITSEPVIVAVSYYPCAIDQPFLVYVVPTELFVNRLFFRPPSVTDARPNWQYTLIAPSKSIGYFTENEAKIPSDKGWKTTKDIPYSFVTRVVKRTINVITNDDASVRFVAYLHYTALIRAAYTELASAYTKIDEPCTITQPSAGDQLDNDCDGRIDEEVKDGKDDDGDDKIDEDFTFKKVNGGWGSWKAYYCNAPCNSYGAMVRRRECVNPMPEGGGMYCSGKDMMQQIKSCSMINEINEANETSEQACPQSCPKGYFTPLCETKCPSECGGQECDRFTGTCLWCQQGLQLSPYCTKTTEESYYPFGDTRLTKEVSSLANYWYFFLVIPIVLLVAYVIIKSSGSEKKKKEENEVEEQDNAGGDILEEAEKVQEPAAPADEDAAAPDAEPPPEEA